MRDNPNSGGGSITITSPSYGSSPANGGPTTGTSDSSGGTGTAEIQNFDASGLPFRFNPPMHKMSRLVRPDLTGASPKSSFARFYNEEHNTYDSDFAVRNGNGKTGFENLRLGRIVMDDMAITRGIIEGGKRYGFRFLYNPAELSGTLNVGTSFIPDQRATNTAVLQSGLETITFEVMLNRIPDVTSHAKTSDYVPQISKDDLKQIRERGTHYDLDFLYRCASGVHNTRARSKTGDIGVLLPNPCRLILGPYTSRGALVSVAVTDTLFSGDLVPTVSYVNITFARFLNMAPSDTARLESHGITREGGSEPSTVAPPSSVGGYGKSLTGKAVYDYAKGAGFSSTEADTMTKIANRESNWNTHAHNGNAGTGDNSYGLWQINMLGAMGTSRRKALGISNNEQLFDPATNARAARMIYKSQGYGAWSVYKNGSYRSVTKTW